jgi:DNA repair protein RadC
MKTTPLFTIKKSPSEFPKVKITTSKLGADFIRQFYCDYIEVFESCFILLLNRQNVTTGYAKISQGGTAGTVIDVKLVAKYAIESLAHGVIIAHNHPSGNLRPSNCDLSITKKIKQGLF